MDEIDELLDRFLGQIHTDWRAILEREGIADTGRAIADLTEAMNITGSLLAAARRDKEAVSDINILAIRRFHEILSDYGVTDTVIPVSHLVAAIKAYGILGGLEKDL